MVLRDPGSTNGSFVDGVRVQNAVLQSGQPFRLGSVPMIFYADGVATARTTPIQPVAVAPPVAVARPVVAQPVVGAIRVASPVVSGARVRVSGPPASPTVVAAPAVAASPAAPAHSPRSGNPGQTSSALPISGA